MNKTYVMSNVNVPFDILYGVALDIGMFEPVMSIPGNGIQCAVHCHDYDVMDAQYATSEYGTDVIVTPYEKVSYYHGNVGVAYEVRKAVIGDNMIYYILDAQGDRL